MLAIEVSIILLYQKLDLISLNCLLHGFKLGQVVKVFGFGAW